MAGNSNSKPKNLAPFFSVPLGDAGYWFINDSRTTWDNVEELGDGWVRVNIKSSASGTNVQSYWHMLAGGIALKPSTAYTFLLEIRNIASASGADKPTGAGAVRLANYATAGKDMFASGSRLVKVQGIGWNADGVHKEYVNVTTIDDFSGIPYVNYGQLISIGATDVAFDIRVSLYEGTYSADNPISYSPCMDSAFCRADAEAERRRIRDQWSYFTREVGKRGVDERGWRVIERIPTEYDPSYIAKTLTTQYSLTNKTNDSELPSTYTTSQGIWYDPALIGLRPGWTRAGLIAYNPATGTFELRLSFVTKASLPVGSNAIRTPCRFDSANPKSLRQCCSYIKYAGDDYSNASISYHSRRFNWVIHPDGSMEADGITVPANSIVTVDTSIVGAHWGGWFSAYGQPGRTSQELVDGVIAYAQRFMDRSTSVTGIKRAWKYANGHNTGGRCPHLSYQTDCSGFIYSAYLYGAGIGLAQDDADSITKLGAVVCTAKAGELLDISKLKPGDVIGFGYDDNGSNLAFNRKFHHVALYLGDNRYAHIGTDYSECEGNGNAVEGRGPFSFSGLNGYRKKEHRVAVRFILDDDDI